MSLTRLFAPRAIAVVGATHKRGIEVDGDALAEILSRVADLSLDLSDLLGQLDIDPIVWGPTGWVALDAQLCLR